MALSIQSIQPTGESKYNPGLFWRCIDRIFYGWILQFGPYKDEPPVRKESPETTEAKGSTVDYSLCKKCDRRVDSSADSVDYSGSNGTDEVETPLTPAE